MDLFKHHLRDKVKQVDLLKHCSRGKIKQVDRFILSRHFQTSFMLKDQASGPFFPEWIFSISFVGKSQANDMLIHCLREKVKHVDLFS